MKLYNMCTPYNTTESGLLTTGQGKVCRVVINSHTSGTLKLIDGFSNGAAATGVLTSSGAMVPADYATSTLTSTGIAVADGDTVTIGTTVYTARTALSFTNGVANEVLIGDTVDGSAFLANLKKAINLTGTIGVDYGAGTVVNPDVIAGTLTSTTLKVWARTIGTTPNTLATTDITSELSWADTTLGGGTGASNPGVTTAGATVTVGSMTYMFVIRLGESFGLTSVANQVLWVTSEAVALDNFKSAINGAGVRGTDYSTATPVNGDVIATTNTNTAQTLVARKIGTSANSIATTETLANYAFGATTLTGGTGTDGKIICDTMTFSAPATTGERFIDLGDLDFSTGLLAVIGGTANLTVAVDTN